MSHYLTIKSTKDGIKTFGQTSVSKGYKIPCADAKPEGCWYGWDFDGRRFVFENDCFGYYPVFYYYDDNCFCISNSILKLAEECGNKQLDEDNLNVFCRCGFFVGCATAFKHIKAVPPDCRLTWQDGKVDIQSTVNIVKPVKRTLSETVEGYIHYFSKAMDKILPVVGEFALPLSGGRDSRQILFELLKRGIKPTQCITCGENRDVQIAKIITERFGLKHKIIKANRFWVNDTLRKNRLTNFCALEHSWFMAMGDYLNRNFKSSFDGTGIGIFTRSELLNNDYIDLYDKGQYKAIAQRLFDHIGPGEKFLSLLGDKFTFIKNGYDKAVDIFVSELAKYKESANPASAFNFYNWNRRAIAANPLAIQWNVDRVLMPFMDKDLYEFVASIEPQLSLSDEPQTLAIKKAYPEFADIPYYNQIAVDPASPSAFLIKTINSLKLFEFLARDNFDDARSLINAKLKPYEGFNRKDQLKFIDVLMYLAQIKHI